MRLIFLAFVSLFTLGLSAAEHPNVVIFLTDDQGWGDLSSNGNTNLATPNIDSIGEQGTTLDNFYVCAVCAPTRAEFLTGRYHPRTGVSGVSEGQGRINPDEILIPEVFKANGYATGAFGKWHNGTQSPCHPNDRGFDEFYGFTSGHWGAYFSPPLDHNKEKIKGNGYVVDDFTDHAIEFIKTNRNQPFFCYVPYNTPHSPMIIDDQWFDKFVDTDPKMKFHDKKRENINMTRAALAMVENIDWNVGRILTTLEELELTGDTIVLFFSDNGPNSYRWNGGMKGRKGTIDEGGLRSPFVIQWPNHITKGNTVETVNSGIDLLPTLAELAGIDLDAALTEIGKKRSVEAGKIDGRSFAGLLTGEQKELPPRTLYTAWRTKISIRTDQFRLDNDGALYDITKDRGQTTDVSDQYPELAEELRAAAAEFRAESETCFQKYAVRPFAVGYDTSTTLPARDGLPHGPSLTRSSKAPNNSFFENWKSTEDSITFDIEVAQGGEYEAIVFYTCRVGDVGATIRLSQEDGSGTEAKVSESFDPPFYDNSKERMENSHYIVKDFKPLELGQLTLEAGHQTLRLTAPEIIGEEAIDVHSIELIRSGN
jgi:arylsulfatase A-like enzyme